MLKRIFTATLVAVGILGFVSVVGNWTTAIDLEFLVYGQSGGTGTGGGGGESGSTTTTVVNIIPQVAAGSYDGGANSFTTIIQVINHDTVSASLTVELFDTVGAVSTVPFTTTDSTSPAFTGSVSSLTIPTNSSIVLTSGTPSSGATNWARITTDRAVSILTVFEFRTSTGTLVSRVGVPAVSSNMKKFLMPRLRNVTDNVTTAFAMVNTSSAPETITGTLYSTTGTVLGTGTLVLAGGNHKAQFATEFFGLTGETGSAAFSHIVFEATSSTMAATALVFEGGQTASFPVSDIGS